jgi:hypothetical protein
MVVCLASLVADTCSRKAEEIEEERGVARGWGGGAGPADAGRACREEEGDMGQRVSVGAGGR